MFADFQRECSDCKYFFFKEKRPRERLAARQVSELLREKLQNTLGDLAEAKARVMELENQQATLIQRLDASLTQHHELGGPFLLFCSVKPLRRGQLKVRLSAMARLSVKHCNTSK